MGLTFVDLFCGIGTIRMGMEQAGHTCTYSVEWDKHKRKIYSIIFGKEPEGADIREVRAVDIPRSDIWTFGAPCQDFSIAGKREGMEGERSSLVLEVFRLVRETKEENRPKYLIYENVKGMLSSNGGRDFLGILDQMATLGYDQIEYSLLNSKNFGVPQNRERVFTVGHLRGEGGRKIFPLGRENKKSIAIVGMLGEGFRQNNEILGIDGICTCLRTFQGGGIHPKILQPCVIDHNKPRFTDDIANCIDANYHKGLDNHGQRTGITQAISIDLKSEKSSTRRGMFKKEYVGALDTNCDVGVTRDQRIRRLTPKECWRLQGIPDEITDKVIAGGVSDAQMYRGAGDACTVNVIYEIAKKLI